MFTIVIMALNGSSHREISACDAYSADTIACREAAALEGTHIVMMHDGDTWTHVDASGDYTSATDDQLTNLGLN